MPGRRARGRDPRAEGGGAQSLVKGAAPPWLGLITSRRRGWEKPLGNQAVHDIAPKRGLREACPGMIGANPVAEAIEYCEERSGCRVARSLSTCSRAPRPDQGHDALLEAAGVKVGAHGDKEVTPL